MPENKVETALIHKMLDGKSGFAILLVPDLNGILRGCRSPLQALTPRIQDKFGDTQNHRNFLLQICGFLLPFSDLVKE
jgi:hypothetical protein